MALAAGAVVWWHGFAVQDARPLASKGFRPPFGLGRVTLERPKVTKGLLPHLFARLTSGSFGSPACPTARADGPSLARRRSLDILSRGLDKRAHLSE
ncbi:hypothetical protein C5B77_05955 [Aeromonas salmonicida]|nr:hypothetical protein C5B77_05955 [Aeromonas salmonicida]